MELLWGIILYGAIVLALTVAEFQEDRRAQAFLKPLAALGFLLIAVAGGALERRYGIVVFGALFLCAIGDILLLSRGSEKKFQAGIFAFLLGHIGLSVGFVILGVSLSGLLIGGLMALVLLGIFYLTFYSKVPDEMKVPVTLYMGIIGMMIICAFGVAKDNGLWVLALGAMMFAVSDIFVARDRFVSNLPINALIITPLYFGAQLIFALSV